MTGTSWEWSRDFQFEQQPRCQGEGREVLGSERQSSSSGEACPEPFRPHRGWPGLQGEDVSKASRQDPALLSGPPSAPPPSR